MKSLPVGISYSGGSSSEWMIEAIIQGVIKRPEHLAIFYANTGDEHEWTYERISAVKGRAADACIPFIECAAAETLPAHLLKIPLGATRADHPPLYVKKDGGGRGRISQRCTGVFKIAPMRKAQSLWLASMGLPKIMQKWVGFGFDEGTRITKAIGAHDVQWEQLYFPAVTLRKTRAEQREDLKRWVGSAVGFSMCRICPYKTPQRWAQTTAADIKTVFRIDEAIRDCTSIGVVEGDCYLTDRLIPIKRLITVGDPEPFLPGLESYCDGGACFL